MRSTASRSKEEAMDLIVKIKNELSGGAKFTDLAAKHSDCPSGQKGGDLGIFGRGQMVPEFDTAVFSMGVGDMSDVIETGFGYHLIERTA